MAQNDEIIEVLKRLEQRLEQLERSSSTAVTNRQAAEIIIKLDQIQVEQITEKLSAEIIVRLVKIMENAWRRTGEEEEKKK
jgi:septum formation inhibitor-activating ATPase MinD